MLSRNAPTDAASTVPHAAELDPIALLTTAFSRAIAAAFPEVGAVDPSIAATKAAPGKARFGDFQCNAAMALSKQVALPPREVAKKIVASLDLGEIAEPVTEAAIAGPGFINITLRASTLGELLARMQSGGLGVPVAAEPTTVVVDLCGVNLAKEMHVGHLRSTVIGDTLARVIARLGHKVIRQNHVGDWGLPIAMVIRRLMDEQAAGRFNPATLTLATLENHYKAAQKSCEVPADGLETARAWHMGPKIIAELEAGREPGAAEGGAAALARAKATLVALQSGDGPTQSMWKIVVATTMASCYDNCARLNSVVTQETDAGESMYRDRLGWVVSDLESRRIAVVDDGALVVHLDDLAPPLGPLDSLLVRKSDGGFLYATTDLAAIIHRVKNLGATRVVYAVDARQSLHFRQVFAVAHKAGYTATPAGPAVLEHAPFGAILGENGRPFKTRSGESFKLADLLDEALERAAAAVSARSAELPPAERDAIARAVAVAAIRYADLSSERIKDYVFSLDRMLTFEGNTGPYLLYALVRIRSIFRKAAERGVVVNPGAPLVVAEPAEKNLALALLGYGAVVNGVAETLMPNRLCQFVYDLAGAFSTFFDQCPVLVAADESTRQSRLRLCSLTDLVLTDALTLLGIPTVDRM